MSISTQVVSVAIILGTRAPQAAGFGTPAVFANAPYIGGRLYSLDSDGLTSMVTDGFTVNDRAYKLVSSMASQSPHAEEVLVWNRAALSTCTLEFTPLVTTVGARYLFDITYKNVTSTIDYTVVTGTVDAIIDAIEALIDASAAGLAGITTTPDNATATKLSLIGATAGEPVMISGASLSMVKLLDVTADAGIATDLAAAASGGIPFYRFVIDTFSEPENNAAAAWAEANSNRFFAHSCDTTDVTASAGTGDGADFFGAAYNRATCCFSGDMDGNMAACLVGRQSALDNGTSGYAYKQLSGVTADSLTSTHLANAAGKNILVYANDDGTPHTFYGKAASGRSNRIQDAVDLLDARIREAVLAVFLSNEYVPMSDRGFAMMEGAVRGVLSNFVSQGIIDPGYIVTVPKAADVSAANKTAGLLTPLKFSCVMPNDMLKVAVSGVVSF
jgi:hypothetical protein